MVFVFVSFACLSVSIADAASLVILQEPRPGPPLPKGEYYWTIGWKQIWQALRQYKKLPYTFIYLFSFFLLADVSFSFGTVGWLMITVDRAGLEHYWYSHWYLSERQVPILVPVQHLSWTVSSGHFYHQVLFHSA